MMKKIFSIVLILAFATYGMALCVSPTIESDCYDFQKMQAEYDLMNMQVLPSCIALNENGCAAILFPNFSDKKQKNIVIFTPEGNVMSFYRFRSYGAAAIELTNDYIIVYLVRDEKKVIYDFNGRQCEVDNSLGGEVSEKYRELTEKDKIILNQMQLIKSKKGYEYTVTLNEIPIYHCSSWVVLRSSIILFVFLGSAIAVLGAFIHIKRQAQSSVTTFDETSLG